MKNHTLRTLYAMIIAMLCALFAPPQRAQAQEAYVHQSPDKATLTFYYDTQRNARQGQTWGIEEKKTVTIRIRGKKISFTIPAWTGYSEHANTVTKKAVFDASFQNIKPTSTKGWFQYLEALHTIEGLQYLNTSQVTDMTGMFAQCNQLEKLDLTTFNTANVSNMTSMFIHCEKLKQINLTSFNTQKVTEMSSMFAQCNQLETILCNSTWQCKNSKYMFQGCTALKGAVKYDASKLDATMANPTNGYFTAQKLEAYVHMSQDKTTLTFFYDKQRYNRQGQTWGINEKRTDLPQVPAWAGIHQTPNTTTKAVFDGSFQNFKPTSTAYWFFFFKKLAAIEGFQYLNTSEVTDMSGMFANCKSLTNINLKNFNTEKVTGMSSMFASCSGLTTLDLKSFNTENVKNMSEMFAFSSALTNLDLTSFNTEKVTDMKDMFAGCSALTTLDLKNFNTSNVTEMNRMFNGCSALKNLDLKNFNTSNVTKMDGMFAYSSALTTLDLSKFNTENVTMMNGMFYNCSTLTTIYCPYTWQCNESEDMFAGCTKLKGAVAYDDSKTDVTMANPKNGYFTIKLEAYVQMSPDQKTLTFFYDKLRHTRQGQTWGIDDLNGDDYPAWAFFIEDESSDANMVTTKTVFDGSFKDFSPTTTFGWFSGYKALTTLEGLKNLNTSEVTNMSEIFKSCQALEKLDLKNFNTENVTDMSQMFYGCSGLKEINLSSFNTQKVETMYGMFAICSALKDINLSSFNTENVKNMSWMFAYSSALTNLDLSSFNTQNVTDMEGMFSRCSGLTSLNLKNFNTSNVTKMKQMFDHCSALQTLNLSSFNTENVTLMNWMFWECSSLKELDLSSFNTGKVEYIFSMFENCAALTTIYCPNTWQGKYSQDMFLGCTALKGAVKYDASKLDVTMANPKNGYFTIKLEAYVHMSPDQKTLTFFYDKLRHTRQGKTWGIEEKNEDGIPAWTHLIEEEDSEWNTTTTKAVFDASFKDFRPTTTDYWFSGFKVLQTIEGLEILNTSEVTDMSYMFSNCPALKNIDLKSFNTEKVETMYGMFYRCSVLTTLDLSSFNTEKVKDMRDMFMNCSSLNTLNLSSFNTQKVMHMNGMFEDCATLTNLDLSSFNTQNVTDMWSMFAGCAALTTLDLSNFKTSNVTEMSKMFAGCSALQTLDLSNFKTEKVQYMTEMFSGCSVLTAIYCANTWQSKESKDMFAGCTKLQGAVKFDASKLDVTMANPTNGYFTKEKPTAIEQMFLNAHKAKGIYTLQGKRVSGNVEHLPAGVYIVNGKKVVVK